MRTDEAYLALLKKDPQEGMAQIIEAFTPVVWAVCARYLPQEEDVRECVNDTFTEFWLQRERFAPDRLHPNDAGHRRIAGAVDAFLRRMF